jgi:hypothetical protein
MAQQVLRQMGKSAVINERSNRGKHEVSRAMAGYS